MIRTLLATAALAPALLGQASAPVVILPEDGATLNRTHVQVRWAPMEPIFSDYTLSLVEDDGSLDLFSGSNPVLTSAVPQAEPRTFVTSGLEFGKDYAWKVSATTQLSPVVITESPVHRFSTLPIPAGFPTPVVTTPQGANPPQPGLTLANLAVSALGEWGFFFATDLAGEPVFILEMPGIRTGDVRLDPNGRLLLMKRHSDVTGFDGDAFEITLDGKVAWESSFGNHKVHHEVFGMSTGNVMVLNQERRTLPYQGTDYEWTGDIIRELDRHSREVVFEWNTFDHYSTDDFRPQWGPGGDWTHGNTAYVDEVEGAIYYSARSLSRITKIAYPSGDVIYHMGEDMPSGDATFGNNFFSMQHAPEPQANGNLLIFDNGNLITPLSQPRQSRVVEIAFNDPVAPTDASVVWTFEPQDAQGAPMYSPFVGDADRQPNGNVLMQHGHTATILECDAQANEVWRLQVGAGQPQTGMYRAERIPSLLVDTPGDTDGDWDLDLLDLGELQAQFTGSGPAGLAFPATLSDADQDDDLDVTDVERFAFWMTGPAREDRYPTDGFEAFCSGDGGREPGCTDCPCGNEAPIATSGGCLNGDGRSARLSATGTASLAADSLAMLLDGANGDTFAVLLSGANALPNQGPCPPGTGIVAVPALDGLRCVGGDLQRHGSRATNAFGSTLNPWAGAGTQGLLAQGGAAVAGQERYFQAFYREDPASGCGSGQNTSNAIRVRVSP